MLILKSHIPMRNLQIFVYFPPPGWLHHVFLEIFHISGLDYFAISLIRIGKENFAATPGNQNY